MDASTFVSNYTLFIRIALLWQRMKKESSVSRQTRQLIDLKVKTAVTTA